MEQQNEKLNLTPHEAQYAHKAEIISTRTGCLGGSDARMLAQVDSLGSVPMSAYKRLALCKGLIENENITNRAMEYGDYVENQIFEHLSHSDSRYKSNPCWVSDKYSRKNVKCIDHIDIMLADEEKQTLYAWEVKTSRHSFEQVRQDYKAQLYHHSLLAKEQARKRGRMWKTKLYLVHYDTSGLDLDMPFEFDAKRMTIKEVKFINPVFNLGRAMDIVDEYLENLEFYSESDIVPANMLPEKIQEQFMHIAEIMRKIKEHEEQVDAFKQKLYEFMVSKGIKSISGEDYSFTVVAPTKSISFDAKGFLADYEQKYPRKAKWIREQFKKVTDKKGFLKVSVNKNNTNNNN